MGTKRASGTADSSDKRMKKEEKTLHFFRVNLVKDSDEDEQDPQNLVFTPLPYIKENGDASKQWEENDFLTVKSALQLGPVQKVILEAPLPTCNHTDTSESMMDTIFENNASAHDCHEIMLSVETTEDEEDEEPRSMLMFEYEEWPASTTMLLIFGEKLYKMQLKGMFLGELSLLMDTITHFDSQDRFDKRKLGEGMSLMDEIDLEKSHTIEDQFIVVYYLPHNVLHE